jgi:hypothetical protein
VVGDLREFTPYHLARVRHETQVTYVDLNV